MRYPRLLRDPRTSFFLFGPRGTGKSTWVRQEFPQALYVDLLAQDQFRRYGARPERIRELVLGGPQVVVVDEVQKVPALLEVVHQLIEERRDVRFVLTGSSARKLRRGGVDLLAGRAILRTMHPFMAAELGEGFDLARGLEFGLLPVVLDSPRPRDVLDAYVGLYLREEVQAEGLVRSLESFSRFLEAASFSHGQLLNVNNVARECEVGRKTVEGYLEVLEDLLLAYRVPVFSRRARRAVVAHAKLYFFDTGVFRSLRPAGALDLPDEIGGAALEGLVAQHLRAWLAYGEPPAALYFWRTRAGTEVDFVVYGARGFWGIEVKNAPVVRPADLRPLRALCEDYPECRPILLYRGSETLEIEGIRAVPCERFLRKLYPDGPLPID